MQLSHKSSAWLIGLIGAFLVFAAGERIPEVLTDGRLQQTPSLPPQTSSGQMTAASRAASAYAPTSYDARTATIS